MAAFWPNVRITVLAVLLDQENLLLIHQPHLCLVFNIFLQRNVDPLVRFGYALLGFLLFLLFNPALHDDPLADVNEEAAEGEGVNKAGRFLRRGNDMVGLNSLGRRMVRF